MCASAAGTPPAARVVPIPSEPISAAPRPRASLPHCPIAPLPSMLLRFRDAEPVADAVAHDRFDAVELLLGRTGELDTPRLQFFVRPPAVVGMKHAGAQPAPPQQ